MEEWRPVIRTDDLADDDGMECTVEDLVIALFRHQGNIYALGAACPHQGGPLANGWLADGCVTCPWHGWRFQLEAPVNGEEDGVIRYPARVRDGWIEVSLPGEKEEASG